MLQVMGEGSEKVLAEQRQLPSLASINETDILQLAVL